MNSNEIIYTEAPKNAALAILTGEIVPDFLPQPEVLVRKAPNPTITPSNKKHKPQQCANAPE
jgi:hypothetical protein